jgi:N6-L-threonylcarbamoyladenine synthase
VGARTICLAGGVAANSALRARAAAAAEEDGLAVYLPSREMCTDNAAMVAAAAWWQLQRSGPSPLDIAARPQLPLVAAGAS